MGGRAAVRRAGQCPLQDAGPGDKRGACHGSEMPGGALRAVEPQHKATYINGYLRMCLPRSASQGADPQEGGSSDTPGRMCWEEFLILSAGGFGGGIVASLSPPKQPRRESQRDAVLCSREIPHALLSVSAFDS